LIEDYLQSLLNIAAASPIISASNSVLDKRTNRSGLIRGDLYFSDGSRLHFRELVNVQEVVVRLMYRYHYQGSDNQLVFRYDDTPHHLELSGFPHQKHSILKKNISTSEPPNLLDVLTEIERNFPTRNE
jgi:hypothetical protein